MSASNPARTLRVQASATIFLVAILTPMLIAIDAGARGRGGGMHGGGRMGHGGGISRGGPARGGSIRHERSGGSYRSRQGDWDSPRAAGNRGRGPGYGGGERGDGRLGSRDREFERPGSLDRGELGEGPRGNLGGGAERGPNTRDRADRPGSEKRTPNGYVIKDRDGQRNRADTANRDGHRGRANADDHADRRNSDRARARASVDNDRVDNFRKENCNGSRCYGGRVAARRRYYYRNSYYYYPYYYGWYSCPPGSMQSWNNRYGTPVYGCANVVVIQTTISMGSGPTETDYKSYSSLSSSSALTAPEASVSSAPVLMFEGSGDEPVYRTTDEPTGVYFSEKDGMYYWSPGPSTESDGAAKRYAEAATMEQPTANSTVITYQVADRIVYLTNEAPLPGYYSQSTDELFVWIPGVKTPTEEESALIARVIDAHEAGGKNALDREVRKLEKGREPPPSVVAEGDGSEGSEESG